MTGFSIYRRNAKINTQNRKNNPPRNAHSFAVVDITLLLLLFQQFLKLFEHYRLFVDSDNCRP